MGKSTGKKIKRVGSKPNDGNVNQNKVSDRSSKAFDEDTAVFINMSQELKEEGNKLFQKHDHEGAMLKYEKALNLLPRNHMDVAYLRSNMASCYMQMGLGEYPRAIKECNLSLQVSPKYSKALLKRARCYEALHRLDLALRDVKSVLSVEPNNLAALEIEDKVKRSFEVKGLRAEDKEIVLPPEYVDNAKRKKNSNKFEKKVEEVNETKVEEVQEKKAVVEEKISIKEEKVVTRTVKLVFGDDIRWAKLPVNCGIRLVRDIVRDRFPSLKGVLVKYRDQESDLVTITTTDELRLAESSGDPRGSLRLHIVEVSLDKEPLYEGMNSEEVHNVNNKLMNAADNGTEKRGGKLEKGSSCIEDWIVQFARLFKNHVGFDSDSCLDLHGLGMKLYSEAMEDTVPSEDAQELFEIAAAKFQEMAALSLFNWGNVHMNRARKRVIFAEDDGSRESILAKVKTAYEWAQKEYVKAGMRYEEALRIKPDFYEGLLALGQQQFEQAKLSWYYAIGSKIDLETGPSTQVLELYNKAEDSMERGMQVWEKMEEQRLNGIYISDKYKDDLKKMGLGRLLKDIPSDEADQKAGNMNSQINILWGTLLYERSVVEFKLDLPTWGECFEVAVEKFELAGASPSDIAVMIKNHCSNGTALEGMGFKIDEIVQAWNEMYDVKRWETGVPSFPLEPLFRRRVPKLHYVLEHV